ncbi:hypothetical protein KY321_03100 [Candidatus Woesearchaeota archaeon]|nr:hypothetical protein [Candidatus Woesearchaeota archaeon]
MSIKEPESMDELVYFTRRALGKEGKAMAWVYRGDCPECGKGKMGKPVDPKTGKPKTRAKEYVCPECQHTIEKQEYEDSLQCQIKYTCDKCQHEGGVEVPFKRKGTKIYNPEKDKKVAVQAVVFECGGCGEKLYITKKMKS